MPGGLLLSAMMDPRPTTTTTSSLSRPRGTSAASNGRERSHAVAGACRDTAGRLGLWSRDGSTMRARAIDFLLEMG